jgi:hypothetical protein
MATLARALTTGRRPGAPWQTVLACLLLAILFVSRGVAAQTAIPQDVEPKIKAAYLLKFGEYIGWPVNAFEHPESPIRIGVMNADEMADLLVQMVAGRTVSNRKVTVYKLRPGDSVAGLNVLYIGTSSRERLADILSMTKGQPILTVTESENALAYGSMINFVIVDGKLRFDIAPKTAELGHLSISARLLVAARKVVPSQS